MWGKDLRCEPEAVASNTSDRGVVVAEFGLGISVPMSRGVVDVGVDSVSARGEAATDLSSAELLGVS